MISMTARRILMHLGSKKHRGQWLVRMEDIDPPREERGDSKSIYNALSQLGLSSNEAILVQSQQLDQYANAIDQLTFAVYPCS